MAYTATALARSGDQWTGQDLDLGEVEDLDAAADLLRDLGGEAAVIVLLVEEDDEYVGIVRVHGDEDPRVFVSDRRVLETSELARRLFGDVLPVDSGDSEDGDPDEDNSKPSADPGGDAGLLADLGTSAEGLLALCAEEGMLPADVIFSVCENAGCVDVLEEVRGAL